MRLRFWIGMAAVVLLAAGAIGAALIVHDNEGDSFRALQRQEAEEAAQRAQALAATGVGQLGAAAAILQAEGRLDRHQFGIVAAALFRSHALDAAGLVDPVPLAQRAAYERAHGIEILERGPGGLRRAKTRPVYYPLTFYVTSRGGGVRGRGFDLGSESGETEQFAQARDTGKPAATPVEPLLLGGAGVVVYTPVYRDGAPTETVAERRRALLGFVAGSVKAIDLARAAAAALPGAIDVQLRAGSHSSFGDGGSLDEPARARLSVADRTLFLVVSDPSRPGISLPLLLGLAGIVLAALLAALIFVWSRNEQVQELQREASEDPLTGLKNRRRFDEDMRLALARARREHTTGALLMLDLDHFKLVNDTFGHPAGDKLIVEVADVLRQRGRESDVLARLGGDEFAVILPSVSAEEAMTAAESIAAAIREHQPDTAEPVTACIGIAIFGDRSRTTSASIVAEADSAMYAAKDGGRDAVRLFDRKAIRAEAPDTT